MCSAVLGSAVEGAAVFIEELIARCPRFSKVVFHVPTEAPEAYAWADPGDVMHLFEEVNGTSTGRRITALVIARNGPRHSFTHGLRASRVHR